MGAPPDREAIARTHHSSTDEFGTSAADDPDGKHRVGAKAQRPEQARGCDLPRHLSVGLAELDLDLFAVREDARKLRRLSIERAVDEVAMNGIAGVRSAGPAGPAPQIHGADVSRLPDLGACDQRRARFGVCANASAVQTLSAISASNRRQLFRTRPHLCNISTWTPGARPQRDSSSADDGTDPVKKGQSRRVSPCSAQ